MSYEDLWIRMMEIERQSGGTLFASNQYGMLFILNKDGRILLQLNHLLSPEEQKKARDAA